MKVLEHCCVSDLGPEELVYGQAGAGGHQPAVAEFTLDHVIAVHSVDEQTRIRADLLQHTHTHTVVKLWGNAWERRSPSVFGGGTPFPYLTRPLCQYG